MVSWEATGEKDGFSYLSPIEASGGPVTVPDAHLLFTAEFSRIGDDLLLTGQDGVTLLVQGYFALDAAPMLLSPLGAMLPPDLVALLVGPRAPGQYAQAGAPEGADSRVFADRPFLAVVTCQAASNHVVRGVRVLSRIVPTVAEAWCRQPGHTNRPRVCRHAAVQIPHAGQANPLGQRKCSKYAAQASSSGNMSTNSR